MKVVVRKLKKMMMENPNDDEATENGEQNNLSLV